MRVAVERSGRFHTPSLSSHLPSRRVAFSSSVSSFSFHSHPCNSFHILAPFYIGRILGEGSWVQILPLLPDLVALHVKIGHFIWLVGNLNTDIRGL